MNFSASFKMNSETYGLMGLRMLTMHFELSTKKWQLNQDYKYISIGKPDTGQSRILLCIQQWIHIQDVPFEIKSRLVV